MKKPILGSILIFFAVWALPLEGLDVGFRISGSLSTFSLSRVNGALEGWAEGWRREAESNPTWTFAPGSSVRIRTGFDFEGEILLSLTSRLALGISSGYAYGEVTEDDTALTVERPAGTFLHARPTKVSGVPLVASLHFKIPLTTSLSFDVRAGAGRIWAEYLHREANQKVTDAKYLYPVSQAASGRGAVFQAGVGLSYQLDPGLAVFIEAGARKARASAFEGETRQGDKGILYAYERYLPGVDYWQPQVEVLAAEPLGSDVRNVAQAEVDLSGLVFRLGIKIKF